MWSEKKTKQKAVKIGHTNPSWALVKTNRSISIVLFLQVIHIQNLMFYDWCPNSYWVEAFNMKMALLHKFPIKIQHWFYCLQKGRLCSYQNSYPHLAAHHNWLWYYLPWAISLTPLLAHGKLLVIMAQKIVARIYQFPEDIPILLEGWINFILFPSYHALIHKLRVLFCLLYLPSAKLSQTQAQAGFSWKWAKFAF